MKCRDIVRELSEFLDGELDAATVSEVERHLAHCEDCSLLVDTTRKTIEVFCNHAPAALPDDVRGRLHSALQSRLRRSS